jgi:predicted peroxiredoxin
MSRKLVFMVTHGPENPERATIPFVLAVAAQAAGIEVVMGFQVEGVLLIKKGCAEEVAAPKFVPLKDLLDIYTSNKGKLYACGPCVASRGIEPADLVEGASVVNAPTFVEQFVTATNVLVY